MPAIVLITLLLTGMAKVSSSLKCFVCTTAGLNHPECLNKQIEGKDEVRDHKNPGMFMHHVACIFNLLTKQLIFPSDYFYKNSPNFI